MARMNTALWAFVVARQERVRLWQALWGVVRGVVDPVAVRAAMIALMAFPE